MTKKFILTGLPRSGTTVIAGSMVVHPEVLLYGELFSDEMYVRQTEASRITMGAGWKFETQLPYGIDACDKSVSPLDYLRSLFAQETPMTAIGFKLMYDQALSGPNGDAWDYVADNTDIKIIQTSREDVIAMICSYVRAKITKRWHSTGDELPSPKFVVPPHEFERLVKKFEYMPKQVQNIGSNHEVLTIPYEAISKNFKQVMEDIYSFLEVSTDVEIKPRLKKIANKLPPDELMNYAELKQQYTDSEYEKYFVY